MYFWPNYIKLIKKYRIYVKYVEEEIKFIFLFVISMHFNTFVFIILYWSGNIYVLLADAILDEFLIDLFALLALFAFSISVLSFFQHSNFFIIISL